MSAQARVQVPQRARRGEVIQIRAIAAHVMETGFRHNEMGQAIPRDIIKFFTCRYNGVEIFRAEFFPAISANPFIEFTTVATDSGKLEFEWTGDKGFRVTESAPISVV